MVGKLVSLNVGMPQDVAWQGRTVHTGIWKRPVEGRRMVRRLNIDGDGQGDLNAHGGEHRAVYVYQLDSYAHWERELGRSDFEPGQFGENFTIEGLADEEVCIGDRFRIGAAEFEVTQPRVTCYRLGMRMEEPRMPALLVAERRPGFYLRVTREGEVAAGDAIERVSEGPERMSVAAVDTLLYRPGKARRDLERATRIPALSKGWRDSFVDLLAKADRATEPEAAWPGFRPLRVTAVVPESASISSFELADPDGELPAATAGQYVTVRVRPDGDAAPLMRSYSLSGGARGGERYRISVKRDGVVSRYLHDQVEDGDTLDVAAPRGSFLLAGDEEMKPIVLLSAGVGATPVLSMLIVLAAAGCQAPVWWIHAAHDASQHAFGAEVDELLARLPDAHRLVLYSQGEAPGNGAGAAYDAIGRLTAARLGELGLPKEADYYVCGPDAFMDDVGATMLAAGVAPERVHTERFGSRQVLASGVVAEDRPPPHQPAGEPGSGPLVSFARSGLEVPWSPEHGSLLELAEACDVPADFGCRTGVCHICETGLLSGAVAYAPDPLEPAGPDQVLLCCSAPREPLALDL